MRLKTEPRANRPHIGVHHRCCNAYGRAYLNAGRSGFEGKCPKCGRQVRLRAGQGGSKRHIWSTD